MRFNLTKQQSISGHVLVGRRQRLFSQELQHGVKTVKLRHLPAKKVNTHRTNSAYFDYYY